MAYDEALADRLRELLQNEPGRRETAMFGGLAFLLDGHLAVAASGQKGLLLRCDPAETESLLDPPAVDRFEMRGRLMQGWLRVDAAAVETDEDLQRWVAHGVRFVRSLPPKVRPPPRGAPCDRRRYVTMVPGRAARGHLNRDVRQRRSGGGVDG